MAFYTIFEQGVITGTTRNCNRHTQGPLRLDLLLSESFSESESTSESTSESFSKHFSKLTGRLVTRASVACNVFATRNIPVLAT